MVNQLNWMDILTILVLIFFAVDGLLKGLILSVFKLGSIFISIFAARLLAPVLSSYVSGNKDIYTGLYNYLEPRVPSSPSFTTAFNILGIDNQQVNGAITSLFITIACFILIFAIIKVLLFVIGRVIKLASKIPVVKQFNKAGGFLFGVLKGVLILYIAFAVLILITPTVDQANIIGDAANSSLFAVYFYKYNFIIQWMSGLA